MKAQQWTAVLCLSFCLLAGSCASTQKPDSLGGRTISSTTEAAQRITESNLTELLKRTDEDRAYFGYVKFSLLLNGDQGFGGVYFQPNRFDFHAQFLTTLPEFQGLGSTEIDKIALKNAGRRVLLGTMYFMRNANRGTAETASPWSIAVEFLSNDPLPVKTVAAALEYLRPNGLFENMFYSPTADQSVYVANHREEFLSANVRLVTSGAQSASRVCYSNGWAVGRVKLVNAADLDGALRAGEITPNDILVMDEAPRELPLVAGLVVGKASSPSSHAALLSQMTRNPFVFEKDANRSNRWIRLAQSGEWVFFSADGVPGGRCMSVVRAGQTISAAEAKTLIPLKRPKPLAIRKYDPNVSGILDLATVSASDVDKVGAKAANVGQMMKIIPDNTIGAGVAIPIARFHEYLEKGSSAEDPAISIRQAIQADLNAAMVPTIKVSDLMSRLDSIREKISKGKMPKTMQESVLAALEAKWPKSQRGPKGGIRLKLRSSSNVEDSSDFNGAGLYESYGVCLGDDELPKDAPSNCDTKPKSKPDPVIKGLKKTWASIYTLKGFLTRRYFGIDERQIGMGVLVHEGFLEELANGVAISRTQPDSSRREELVVMSTGFAGDEDSVTNPTAGKIPETTRITANGFDVLVHSSNSGVEGGNILEQGQYRELHGLIEKVHRFYQGVLPEANKGSLALDMEWKVVRAGAGTKLILKQVRPLPKSERSLARKSAGTLVLGERSVLLCPMPQEYGLTGMDKLRSVFPLKLSVRLHAIPSNNESGLIKNPVESLNAEIRRNEFVRVPLPAMVNVAYEDWMLGEELETRSVVVSVPINVDGRPPVALSWMVQQYNQAWEYAADLYASNGLTETEMRELRAKKIRYVVISKAGGRPKITVKGIDETGQQSIDLGEIANGAR